MTLPPPSSLYPTLSVATLVLVVGLGWASARDTEATFASPPDSPPQAFHRQAIRERALCLTCHTEHRGAEARITDEPLNPHGEFIFRVTGTQSCRDCHAGGASRGPKYGLLDNDAVRGLVAKGQGAHGPGRFADCFRCHAGGRTGAERGL